MGRSVKRRILLNRVAATHLAHRSTKQKDIGPAAKLLDGHKGTNGTSAITPELVAKTGYTKLFLSQKAPVRGGALLRNSDYERNESFFRPMGAGPPHTKW